MTTIIDNLLALRAQMDATIAAVMADGSGSKLMPQMPKGAKSKVPKAEKKPRANAGQGTAWSAFSSKIQKEHKEEIDVVKAAAAVKRKAAKEAGEEAPENTKGPHLHWCSAYKEAHPDEWLAFKSVWEAEHPKGSHVASSKTSQASSSDAEGEEGEGAGKQPKKRGAKKYADMTPEELVAAKAKRAAAKASKAASKAETEEEEAAEFAPEIAPAHTASVGGAVGGAAGSPAEAADEEESDDSLIPFTLRKVKYLRWGHLDEDDEEVWHEDGDLWFATPEGGKGAYAGKLKPNKQIDSSPEAMALEPDVCT